MVHGVDRLNSFATYMVVTVISLKRGVREDVLKVAEETEHDSLLACEMSKHIDRLRLHCACSRAPCRFPMTGNNSRSAISAV